MSTFNKTSKTEILLSVCLSVFLSFCLSVFLSFCLSVFLSFSLSVCLSVCLSICLSVCLSVYVPTYCPMTDSRQVRRQVRRQTGRQAGRYVPMLSFLERKQKASYIDLNNEPELIKTYFTQSFPQVRVFFSGLKKIKGVVSLVYFMMPKFLRFYKRIHHMQSL